MFRYEVAAAMAPLKAEAEASLRSVSAAATPKAAELLGYAADRLFDPGFDTGRTALADLSISRNVTTAAGRALGASLGLKSKPLRIHVNDLRIDVARRFLAAYPDAPLWMVIAEIGIPSPEDFDRLLRARGGSRPDLYGRILPADFDYVTFDRERRDRLAPKDRVRLVEYLRRVYPADGAPRPERALPAEAALPVHRFGCRVEILPRGPRRAVLLRALEDGFFRLAGVRSRLWLALQLLFDVFCEHLFTDPAVDYTGAARLRDADHDLRAELGFLLGEYVADYRHREQVQLATPMIAETTLNLTTIARVVGLSEAKLVQVYKARTGERPSAVRGGPEPREPYDLWRRAPRGKLTSEEMARLIGVLQRPPAPQTARILLPGWRPTEVDVDPRFLIPPEEWEALRSVAAQLTWENRLESRPEIERTLSVSKLAPSLYRMRQVQCVETAYRQLVAGRKPAVDPYASWLQHRRKADRKQESPLKVWEGVVGGLADAPESFAALEILEEKRCRLLAMPEAKRRAAIEDSSKGFQDYRLAWWCLIVEEAFHRSYGDVVVAQGQIAVWIAEALPEETQCGVTRGLFAVGSARLGNGYKIDGLIDTAYERFATALAATERIHLGPYVEGEIRSLYAAVRLSDHGTSAAQARELFEQAIGILTSLDQHLAAKATVMMAEAQRHETGSGYLETVTRGIAGLDGLREPVAKAMAEYNLRFYLVTERRIQEAKWLQTGLRYPKIKLLQARHLAIDGCIEIAVENFEFAEMLLRRALDIFAELGRRHDLVSIYLYLACIRYERKDLIGCRDRLESALIIAKVLGLAQAPAIAGLVCRITSEQRVVDLILAEALKAGGCLGPKAEAA